MRRRIPVYQFFCEPALITYKMENVDTYLHLLTGQACPAGLYKVQRCYVAMQTIARRSSLGGSSELHETHLKHRIYMGRPNRLRY